MNKTFYNQPKLTAQLATYVTAEQKEAVLEMCHDIRINPTAFLRSILLQTLADYHAIKQEEDA